MNEEIILLFMLPAMILVHELGHWMVNLLFTGTIAPIRLTWFGAGVLTTDTKLTVLQKTGVFGAGFVFTLPMITGFGYKMLFIAVAISIMDIVGVLAGFYCLYRYGNVRLYTLMWFTQEQYKGHRE